MLIASDARPSGGFGGSIWISGDLAAIGSSGDGYLFGGIQGPDCNETGLPDACDIALGKSQDDDGDGVPDECQSIPGDINADGIVDVADLVELILAWGPCPAPCPVPDCEQVPCTCPADIEGGNCIADVLDLVTLLLNWTS
jgi:hypothetical protein